MKRKFKSILLTAGLTLGLSLSFTGNAFASAGIGNGSTPLSCNPLFNTTVISLVRNGMLAGTTSNIKQLLNLPEDQAPSGTSKALSQPVSTYSQEDLDLLSRLITAEAQGESYNAKVSVGAVVMNRVKSGLFANSISGVIYQNIDGHYQFTPVMNGWINKPAEAQSIAAAKEALGGKDPTNGALFFFDDTITNKWLLERQVSIKIDNMIFTY